MKYATLSGDDDGGDGEDNDNNNADNSDNSDASEDEDWESDDGQNDGQDDDFDTMMNDSNMATKGSDKSPFAPAEMYLSDMIGLNKNPHTHGDDENEGDFLLVNVSDNLVFSPIKLDPLWGKDLQGSIIELLLSLKSGNGQG